MDVPTTHPIVDLVRDAIVGTTGGSLVGLYLYGSLATGDFEEHVSDIDLIAVLTDVPDASLVRRLRRCMPDSPRIIESGTIGSRSTMSRHAVSPSVERGRRRSPGLVPASPSIWSRPVGTSSSTGTRRAATESRSSVHRSIVDPADPRARVPRRGPRLSRRLP